MIRTAVKYLMVVWKINSDPQFAKLEMMSNIIIMLCPDLVHIADCLTKVHVKHPPFIIGSNQCSPIDYVFGTCTF